jgi:hypothetical protein
MIFARLKNCKCPRIASRTRSKNAQAAQTYATRIFLSRHLGIHHHHHHHRCAMSQCRGVSRIHCVLRKHQFLSLPSPNLNPRCSASLSARGTMGAITRLRPLGTSSDVACDFLEIAHLQCSRVFRPPPHRCASLEMRAVPHRTRIMQAV